MKVKEFAAVVSGATPSSEHPEYYGGDIVWFTPKDLALQSSKYVYAGERTITQKGLNSCPAKMIPAGSVLMSSRAPIGLLAVTKTDCCTNQGFKSFIVNEEICNPEYLYYYLKAHVREIEALGCGTTFKEVSKTSVEEFDVDLPDLQTQTKIARVLSDIDDKIANNNAICADLEAMAKLLYDYWFVQFDFPDENGKPYKSSGGKMVWNEELKREIPEGWRAVETGSLCTVISGYPFDSSTYDAQGPYSVLTIKNIQDGYIEPTTDSKISVLPNDIPACDILKPGDILMSLTGNVGRVGLLCGNNYLLNQRAAVVSPRYVMDKWFLYFLMRNNTMAIQVQRYATGTSQKNVSPADIHRLSIPYNLEISKKFFHVVNKFMELFINANKENQELASLRDFLLPLLMNGQVGFKED